MFKNNRVGGGEAADTKVFWTIAGVTFVIFLAISLAVYFTLPSSPVPFNPPATEGQLRFLKACGVAECLICAIGFSWLFSVGWLIRKVPPKIRKKIIGMHICCSWFLISWFPHITLHTYFARNPWGTIALDFAFHWTILFAAIFLATFFYSFIKKMSGYKNHNKFFSHNWFKTDIFMVASITVVLSIVMAAGIQRAMQPTIPATYSQNACNIFIGVTEAIASGFGFAFLVGMCFMITKIKDKTVQWKAVLAVVSIWWLLSHWWFHSRLHAYLPSIRGIDPIHWILTEVFLHWVTMFACAVVCYNIYGLIRLAESAGVYHSKTEQSRNASSKAKSGSAISGSKDVDIPMNSISVSSRTDSKEDSKDQEISGTESVEHNA